ncbi:class 2 F G isoform [Brachionus plicatilis]|uniref:Class 2 F G isoform n=1 Tax=Brachionus plicatilis TaxID=10195 RepID=A0A3M7R9B8_BRAPC|nr:class 2 F G isoform [Brachionus plicatilis]
MNVQTTSTSNGPVIKSNQESNFSNEPKSTNSSNHPQPAHHPQSQLEITGVSRSSHPVTSQKESNRFRIVKTDADRKNESTDENNQNLTQTNDQSVNQQNKLTDVNTIQAKNQFNNYQRGRWYVAEFSTENLSSAKSSNQSGLNGSNHISQTNVQNQTKNEESTVLTNVTPNQPNPINSNEQGKVLSNAPSNASNQSQSTSNPETISNYYTNNQVYHQSTQTSAQNYQILSQASSSNFSQSNANNNLVGTSSHIAANQNPTQNSQLNVAINNQHTDNTQSNIQQNFPSQAQNQSVNVPSTNTKENISVGTQANSQIPPQQASPKDQNLVKLPNGINSSENLQYNSKDSDAGIGEQTLDTKKADSGIHDKIAEAMDMVKSHLTQAVRDEIVTLKNQIKNLREHCNRLEQENRLLKTKMPSDILRQLESMGIFSYSANLNGENDNRTQDNMLSSFTEKVINKNDFLNNLQTSSK